MCEKPDLIDDDLETMLVKFSMSNLIEQPEDVVSFALDYFKDLQNEREQYRLCQEITSTVESDMELEAVEEEDGPQLEFRRNCVYCYDYNPQEDFSVEKIIHPKTNQEYDKILNTIRYSFPFNLLDRRQMEYIINAMYPVEVTASETIVHEGTDANMFYVIYNGVFCMHTPHEPNKPSKLLGVLEQNGFFGEMAVCHVTNYDCNVKAVTDGKLWALKRFSYRSKVTKADYHKRKYDEHLISCMPLFRDLPVSNRMNIVDNLTHKIYNPGETIVRVGDLSRTIYFVVSGVVKITVINDCGLEVVINHLEKSEYFGETGYLWNRPSSFSAYADDKSEVELAFLEIGSFERLIGPVQETLGKTIFKFHLKSKPSFYTEEDAVC